MKKGPRPPLPNTNTKLFFFPMGNRAPLNETEEEKRIPTKPSARKPQRPMTAQAQGSSKEHRMNRPLSPKVEFG